MGTDEFNAGVRGRGGEGEEILRWPSIPYKGGGVGGRLRNRDKLRLDGQHGCRAGFNLYFICSFNLTFGHIFSDLNQAKLPKSSYFILFFPLTIYSKGKLNLLADCCFLFSLLQLLNSEMNKN